MRSPACVVSLLVLATAAGCTHVHQVRVVPPALLGHWVDVHTRAGRAARARAEAAPGGMAWRTVSGATLPHGSVDEVVDKHWGRAALAGLGIGLAAGAGVGAAVGYAQGNDSPCGADCGLFSRASDKAWAFGFLFAVGGGVVGAFAGGLAASRDVYEIGAGGGGRRGLGAWAMPVRGGAVAAVGGSF